MSYDNFFLFTLNMYHSKILKKYLLKGNKAINVKQIYKNKMLKKVKENIKKRPKKMRNNLKSMIKNKIKLHT